MMVMYAFERRGPRFILAFAVGCAPSSSTASCPEPGPLVSGSDLACGADAKRHALGQLRCELASAVATASRLGIEGEDTRCLLGQAGGQSPVAAADLDHRHVLEVGEPAQRGKMGAFRIEERAPYV